MRRGPLVSVKVELDVRDDALRMALSEALSADADDRRFPLRISGTGSRILVEPSGALDAGDARAFLSNTLLIMRSAEAAIRAASGQGDSA